MVPADLLLVDELPVTDNGKVDRKSLQALKASAATVEAPDATPATDAERSLVSIFKELLGVEHLNVEENFFELGATSLHIIRAHNLLRATTGEQVPVVKFFRYPTIKSLAANLGPQRKAAADAVPAWLSPDGAKSPGQRGQLSSAARGRDAEGPQGVAVIGMSCRFPGAAGVAAFWRNLRGGVESIRHFSDAELLAAGRGGEALSREGYVKAGAVLEGWSTSTRVSSG